MFNPLTSETSFIKYLLFTFCGYGSWWSSTEAGWGPWASWGIPHQPLLSPAPRASGVPSASCELPPVAASTHPLNWPCLEQSPSEVPPPPSWAFFLPTFLWIPCNPGLLHLVQLASWPLNLSHSGRSSRAMETESRSYPSSVQVFILLQASRD